MRFATIFSAVTCCLVVTACGRGDEVGIGTSQGPAFSDIDSDEVIRLTGTEPFWGGSIGGNTLTYTTVDNPEGSKIAVTRFAGNNGLGFSGSLNGRSLDLAITPGSCSDGMSDRKYPFHVTLRIGNQQLAGCAWSDNHSYSGSERP